jgi:predicted transposase YdaD
LGDFIIKVTLERHRAEVKGMLLTEYNEAQAMELFREEGRAEGRAEGRTEGRVEGEDRLARLMKLLFGQRRFEDAQRAATDAAFRDQLYREFQIA